MGTVRQIDDTPFDTPLLAEETRHIEHDRYDDYNGDRSTYHVHRADGSGCSEREPNGRPSADGDQYRQPGDSHLTTEQHPTPDDTVKDNPDGTQSLVDGEECQQSRGRHRHHPAGKQDGVGTRQRPKNERRCRRHARVSSETDERQNRTNEPNQTDRTAEYRRQGELDHAAVSIDRGVVEGRARVMLSYRCSNHAYAVVNFVTIGTVNMSRKTRVSRN